MAFAKANERRMGKRFTKIVLSGCLITITSACSNDNAEQQQKDGTIVLTCVEFPSEEAKEKFEKDHTIPEGSLVSNVPAKECRGLPLALN